MRTRWIQQQRVSRPQGQMGLPLSVWDLDRQLAIIEAVLDDPMLPDAKSDYHACIEIMRADLEPSVLEGATAALRWLLAGSKSAPPAFAEWATGRHFEVQSAFANVQALPRIAEFARDYLLEKQPLMRVLVLLLVADLASIDFNQADIVRAAASPDWAALYGENGATADRHTAAQRERGPALRRLLKQAGWQFKDPENIRRDGRLWVRARITYPPPDGVLRALREIEPEIVVGSGKYHNLYKRLEGFDRAVNM